MKKSHVDQELEDFRGLLETPKTFKNGFGWTTVIGILFCGIVMLPGSIYLGLMTGGDMTSAATWVTLILFGEVARRALKPLPKENLIVLHHAAGFMIAGAALMPGGPFGQLVFRAYIATSDAIRDSGMRGAFPDWWVPSPDSAAIMERNLLHADWLVPILIILVLAIIGLVKRYTLGYFFFRLTSDIEKLPFPLAPIAAQGVMALAEEGEAEGGKRSLLKKPDPKEIPKPATLSRWRLFSMGVTFGLIFGFVQVGIPAVTGLFLAKPVYLIPQPFLDTTTITQSILPATPTGVVIDAGVIILGFVLPFYAVLGTFIAIVLTMVLNPILRHFGVLTQWQPGMDTVNTAFSNRVDFWFSFEIGSALAIFLVSILAMVRQIRAHRKNQAEVLADPEKKDSWELPKGRGDFPLWAALGAYVLVSAGLVALIYKLVPQFPLSFLILFAFVYTPFISYVNARLLGISGQTVEIPFLREGAFILSGAKGIDIWLAPIPIENYGGMAQSFRVTELTGVNFWSLIKADLVALPILFICSMMYWSFIWKSNAIPSEVFPAAQVKWELASKNQALVYSSTFVPPGEDPKNYDIRNSEFFKAVNHPWTIFAGFAGTTLAFAVLSAFGLPVLLVYGFVRGIGDLPHGMVLEIVGAILGRFYFQKKLGKQNFLRMAPTLLAGYFTGVGLMAMATISLNLIKQAITSAPF